MKNLKLLFVAAVCGVVISSCGQGAGSSKVSLKTGNDTLSYALGYSIACDFAKQFPEADITVFTKAVNAAYAGDSSIFSSAQDANVFIQSYMTREQSRIAAENIEKGKAFLAENKGKEGVIETESGLQYKVIKEGTGAYPTEESIVKVNYKGTLIDGTEFDSSTEGEPIEFPINRVIPGWTEGLQLMRVGAKYQLYIPSDLAYGSRSIGGKIPANSTLIFDVELLDIVEEK